MNFNMGGSEASQADDGPTEGMTWEMYEEAGRELEYLFMLFTSLGFSPKKPVRVLEDNQSAISEALGSWVNCSL